MDNKPAPTPEEAFEAYRQLVLFLARAAGSIHDLDGPIKALAGWDMPGLTELQRAAFVDLLEAARVFGSKGHVLAATNWRGGGES